ncbi:hypothetical protein Prudu_018950, partial [Prunus dulcis]
SESGTCWWKCSSSRPAVRDHFRAEHELVGKTRTKPVEHQAWGFHRPPSPGHDSKLSSWAGRALSKEDDFWKLDCDGELEMEAAYISGNTRALPTPYTFRPLYPDMPRKVDELIDPTTKQWREGVIGFKHGRYVVKSGYELTRHLQHNGELGRKGEGETSSTHGRNEV